jgi:hypothetical protein
LFFSFIFYRLHCQLFPNNLILTIVYSECSL